MENVLTDIDHNLDEVNLLLGKLVDTQIEANLIAEYLALKATLSAFTRCQDVPSNLVSRTQELLKELWGDGNE